MDLLGNIKGGELSVINNPFNKDKVVDVYMRGSKRIFGNGNFYWHGSVKFKNGNTEAEQKTPDCNSFEELIAAMKQIFESIK